MNNIDSTLEKVKKQMNLSKDSSILRIVKNTCISPRKFYRNKIKKIKDLYAFDADDFINIFKFSLKEFCQLNYFLNFYNFELIAGSSRYISVYPWTATPLPSSIIKNREEFISQDISELELTVRSENGLRRQGINTIKQLTNYTSFQLSKFPGLGSRSIEEILEKTYLFGV